MNIPAEFERQLKRFRSLSPIEGRRAAFRFVRDLHYGDIGSRNPFDVLMAKKGTCSGKHALLRLFFEGLGYGVQSFFAVHDFSTFPINLWPVELRKFQHRTITDYHDFLKVKVGDRWLTVDAMFDAPLAQRGFPVHDWDGESDMQLPVQSQETFPAEGDAEDHKKRLVASLPEQTQKDRKQFLSALTTWIDGQR